jgi:hypothetical protein
VLGPLIRRCARQPRRARPSPAPRSTGS